MFASARGVVQLFNSVKIQQKTIQDKLRDAGPLERKREKALKSLNKEDFFELLKGGKRVKAEVINIPHTRLYWTHNLYFTSLTSTLDQDRTPIQRQAGRVDVECST